MGRGTHEEGVPVHIKYLTSILNPPQANVPAQHKQQINAFAAEWGDKMRCSLLSIYFGHSRYYYIVSFVRLLLRAGVQPTLDSSAETFYVGPMRQPKERRGIGRCVRCMCELCRVEEGLSRREKLVRYF